MGWIVDESPDTNFMAKMIIENPTWIAIEDEGGHVAYCHPGNADLIAAAPELLEALDAVRLAFEQGYYVVNDRGETHAGIIETINAAIAKARGQA